MKFSNTIHFFHDGVNKDFFPKRFGNEIYHSKVKSFFLPAYKTNFTIKFCRSGSERYNVDGKEIDVQKNQYLILNEGQEVIFHTRQFSDGLSIFLEKEVLQDVYYNLTHTEKMLLDYPMGYNSDPIFRTFQIPAVDPLGAYLAEFFEPLLDRPQSIDIHPGDYYKFAYKLIISQHEMNKKIHSIDKVRKSTREEIYKRLLLALEYLHQSYKQSFDLEEVANKAYLSKFHFLRMFKQAFGKTPFQYHQMLKMKDARKQVESGSKSIKEIGFELGFAEISSFSKSFYNYFGVYPTKLHQEEGS